MKTDPQREGILAGGNFIIDVVKIIDAWPEPEMLAGILSESQSNGGGPYNLLKDLAAMKAGFPLEAAGLVGDDDRGAWILEDCREHGIDTGQLKTTLRAPTSYTDAMTEAGSGRRTFFHMRGANALLDVDDFDFTGTRARMFYLGYLMLLDRLDAPHQGGVCAAAQVLKRAGEAGLVTALDLVSSGDVGLRKAAGECLPWTDHLVLNELEAGHILGRSLRTEQGGPDLDGIRKAAMELVERGVRECAVIHFAEGVVARPRDGEVMGQTSLRIPTERIEGATGAGDAFAAGYLFGVHEGWTTADSVRLGICAAATCLEHPTASGGLRTVEECLELESAFGRR